MKKLIILLFLLNLPVVILAQQNDSKVSKIRAVQYKAYLEAQYDITNSNRCVNAIGANLVNAISFWNTFSLGLGLGINSNPRKDDPSHSSVVSAYAVLETNLISAKHRFVPYIYLVPFGIDTEDNLRAGLGGGVRYKINKNQSLRFGMGWTGEACMGKGANYSRSSLSLKVGCGFW